LVVSILMSSNMIQSNNNLKQENYHSTFFIY